MNNKEIIKILHDWNSWKNHIDTGIYRDFYIRKLKNYIESDQVITITGSRRSGKSYIMRQMVEDFVKDGEDKSNILFVNFEDPRFTNLNLNLIQKIYESYLEFIAPQKKPIIFLDEVQEIENWEKWVRYMHELKKAKIIVSGSNAKLLSDELGTLLTGRHISLKIFPLSFKEFLKFNNCAIENRNDILVNEIKIKNFFRKYLEFGSFPEVVLKEQKKEILLNYFDDIVNKDLVRRFKIRKKEELKNLIKYYFANLSSLASYNSLEKFIGLTQDTIEKISSYFEQIFLIFFVKRFSFKYKEQIKSPKKVYAIDTGLANTIGFRFFDNYGHLFENVVFLELKRMQAIDPTIEIFYWKDEYNKEVDFVLKKGLNVYQLIQVCYNLENLKTREREIGSLIKAMKEFNLNAGTIITEDYDEQEKIAGRFEIQYIPLWKWLL